MTNRNRFLIVVLLLALIVLALGPVAAQEVTEEAPPVEEPEEPPVVDPDAPIMERVITFLTGALAGGAAVLITVFGTIGRFKNDKATLDMIEWLGRSIPPEALDKLNEIGRNMRDAGDVLDKISDGQPNAVTATRASPEPTIGQVG